MSCQDATLSHHTPLELLLLCQNLTPLEGTQSFRSFFSFVCMKYNVILLT